MSAEMSVISLATSFKLNFVNTQKNKKIKLPFNLLNQSITKKKNAFFSASKKNIESWMCFFYVFDWVNSAHLEWAGLGSGAGADLPWLLWSLRLPELPWLSNLPWLIYGYHDETGQSVSLW